MLNLQYGGNMYHTVNEVAEKLNTSIWTVYRMIRRHEIGAVKFGGSLRVTTEEIERFLDDKKIKKGN
jgi:excisionase family DNA binding protein